MKKGILQRYLYKEKNYAHSYSVNFLWFLSPSWHDIKEGYDTFIHGEYAYVGRVIELKRHKMGYIYQNKDDLDGVHNPDQRPWYHVGCPSRIVALKIIEVDYTNECVLVEEADTEIVEELIKEHPEYQYYSYRKRVRGWCKIEELKDMAK